MPLPILHSYAGYSICRFWPRTRGGGWKLFLAAAVLANMADLDYLPGLWMNDAMRFHHGFTHSLGAAALCGLAAGAVAFIFKKMPFWKSSLFFSAAYASHVALDFLCDRGGLPIFWPLSSKIYVSPIFSWLGLALPVAAAAAAARPHLSIAQFLVSLTGPACLFRVQFESAVVAFGWLLGRHLEPVPSGVRVREAAALTGIFIFLAALWSFTVRG